MVTAIFRVPRCPSRTIDSPTSDRAGLCSAVATFAHYKSARPRLTINQRPQTFTSSLLPRKRANQPNIVFDATYAWDNEGRITTLHYPGDSAYCQQYGISMGS